MRIDWLSNPRPDCLFKISQLAQITRTIHYKKRPTIIFRLDRAIKHAIKNDLRLFIYNLALKNLLIVCFSDYSFAKNHDIYSQLEHIVFPRDASKIVIPLFLKVLKGS